MSASGDKNPGRIDALLRRINDVSLAIDHQVDEVLGAEPPFSSRASDPRERSAPAAVRTWTPPAVLGLGLGVLVLLGVGYQAWLTVRLHRTLIAQADQLRDQAAALSAQSEALRAYGAQLQKRSAEVGQLKAQITAATTAREAQSSQLETIARRSAGQTRLLEAQVRHLRALRRTQSAELRRAAIDTLSEVKACAHPGSGGALGDPACPGRPRRARQEAFVTYMQASTDRLDLSHTRLDQLDLSRVDLKTADLSGAELLDADIRGADLASTRGLQRPQRWCFDEQTAFPSGFEAGSSHRDACRFLKPAESPREAAGPHVASPPRG